VHDPLHVHAHGCFAYLDEAGEHRVIAGHLGYATIGYTGELVIDPVRAPIGRKFDAAAGITVWDLDALAEAAK
jgi:predicted DNA-binding protein with PD1-like motif